MSVIEDRGVHGVAPASVPLRDDPDPADPAPEPRSVKVLALLSMKRGFDLYDADHDERTPAFEPARELAMRSKIHDEFSALGTYVPRGAGGAMSGGEDGRPGGGEATATRPSPALAPLPGLESASARVGPAEGPPAADAFALVRVDAGAVAISGAGAAAAAAAASTAAGARPLTAAARAALAAGEAAEASARAAGASEAQALAAFERQTEGSAAIARRAASQWPRPAWHAPWRCYRVIAGHLGWVRCVAFEPGNEWFATGSGDRTIKVWDVASGRLKLTLTGHIEQVTGVQISARSPYMYSCGLDKQVKCWDLESNKVVRNYHGHLSGVRCLALHPELEVLATGGRDATCRVWDARTRTQVHCLSGHDDAVAAVVARSSDPQIITASHDKTVRLWDLRTGKTLSTLTYHKKSVRALAAPTWERTFASAGADGIKRFGLPRGEFLHNALGDQRAILNGLALNDDGVLASAGDDGSLWFWDYRSGAPFQRGATVAQPGSLEGETGIHACAFDITGSRLVTCEADKSVKMWREDRDATPETHPIDFVPPSGLRRY